MWYSTIYLKKLCLINIVSFSCQKKNDFESVVMEHIRVNGAYWGLTTLDILGKLNVVDQDEVISWLMECQHESGLWFGPSLH